MKKPTTTLLLLITSYTSSFYKMSDGFFFQDINKKYAEVSQKNLPTQFNIAYSYDSNLHYYLNWVNTTYSSRSDFWMSRMFLTKNDIFYIFKQSQFDLQWWENLFDLKIGGLIFINYTYSPFPILSMDELLERIFDRHKRQFSSYNCPLDLNGFDSIFGIKVVNKKTNITLKNLYSKYENIKFQPALLNYMKAKKQQQEEQLAEHVPHFVRDINDPKLTKNKELKVDSISKIANASKITYTQEQINLLENSKILAIWHIPPKKYTNKEYLEEWNKRHPEQPKQVKSKMINPIIIGFAYDLRDNMTYNWITDLGDDISILFNYADELKTIKK